MMTRRAAAAIWGVLGVAVVVALWELYKFLGPADGVTIGGDGSTGSGVMILPRTHDRAMPHVWEMVARLFASTSGGDTPPLWVSVLSAAGVTLGIAAAGWVIGVLVGGTRMDALEAVANGNRITVETRKDPAMGIDNATPRPGQDGFAAPAPANEAAPPLARLDALEVALRFQVGELSISLGDLKSVGPGHVFELADPLNRSTVRIVAPPRAIDAAYESK